MFFFIIVALYVGYQIRFMFQDKSQIKYMKKPNLIDDIIDDLIDVLKVLIEVPKVIIDDLIDEKEQVKVTIDYESNNPNELDLHGGDIITVIDKKESYDNFWRGKLNGKVGLFPVNFVVPYIVEEVSKPIKPSVIRSKPTATRPKSSMPFTNGANVTPKNNDLESEAISFESPTTHKRLLGPTADRTRRRNIRLPEKGAKLNDPTDEISAIKEKSKTLPLQRDFNKIDFTSNDDPVIPVETVKVAKSPSCDSTVVTTSANSTPEIVIPLKRNSNKTEPNRIKVSANISIQFYVGPMGQYSYVLIIHFVVYYSRPFVNYHGAEVPMPLGGEVLHCNATNFLIIMIFILIFVY